MLVKQVIPSHRGSLVAKLHLCKLIFEHISSEITGCIDPVVLIDDMVSFGVKIIEVQGVVPQVFILCKQDPIEFTRLLVKQRMFLEVQLVESGAQA